MAEEIFNTLTDFGYEYTHNFKLVPKDQPSWKENMVNEWSGIIRGELKKAFQGNDLLRELTDTYYRYKD